MDSRRYRNILFSMQPEATARLVVLDGQEGVMARKQLDFQVWLGDLAEERVQRKVDRQYELVRKQTGEGLTAEEAVGRVGHLIPWEVLRLLNGKVRG